MTPSGADEAPDADGRTAPDDERPVTEGAAAAAEESERSATGRLVRSSAVVGVGTGLSRLSGLLRVGALTYALGATALSDAYNLANTTPNIVYELILGGILSATLVPIFVDHLEHDDDEGTSTVVTVAVVCLAALTLLAMLAAPLIIDIYALRLPEEEAAAQAAVAVPLLWLFLPQIFFYGLTTLGTALLNARRSFFAPAYAPILNNVVVIAMLVGFASVAGSSPSLTQVEDDRGLLLLLGIGTTAGIVAMTVALWPAIRRAGIRLRFRFDLRHPSVRKVGSLSGWTLGYAASNQVALFAILALATGEGAGAVSAYTYAFIFFQLPHGLLAVSLMTTFLPDLSAFAARGDLAGYRDRFGLGLRLLVLVILPAAVGYVLLARPVVAALLERGAFGDASGDLTAEVLAAMALGLVGFSLYLFVLRGFYALKDTRTPFLLNLFENGVNVGLAFALVGRFGVQGLALAYAGAYTLAGLAAVLVLRHRIRGMDGARTLAALARMAAAAVVMALAVLGARELVGSDEGLGAIARTGAGIGVGAVVYLGALYLLRLRELHELVDRLRRRRAGTAATTAL
ncbi:MAG: murein biosynthesis integral membrane protein MurJ [Acidimicrobiales bacterium]|nr:murein biosynthesis integral membrane protein MurJ [Acidimicrobiales bacterium]MCB9372877.1 murein biosynthesis integral membrane protein MurJ [Microthrixaceae bacterium]